MTTAMALAISTDVGVAFAVCGVGGGGEKEAGEVRVGAVPTPLVIRQLTLLNH